MTFGSYSYQQETGLQTTHNLPFNFDGHSRGDEAIASSVRIASETLSVRIPVAIDISRCNK